MTVQIVIFTVMLFGAIGFVIDFGRAYSAHSQMQSYIDQVALAAAAELDGREDGTDIDGNPVADAIERATAAAEAVSKTSLFTTGGGEFAIAQLVFLTGAPTDANGEFDYSLVTGGTLTTTDPALATHVLAIAEPASVRASLLDLNIGELGGGIGEIPIGTYAVAKARQVTCEGMSTLVMCNPFEEDSTRSLQSVFQSGAGYRMRLTSSTSLGLDYTGTQIGLGLIRNPMDTLGTNSGVCEDDASLPGYAGQTGEELEELRDKCLLAVVDTGLSCVNDELLVKEASPGTIVTGLNPIFDLWDDEMAAVLASDMTLADGRQRSELFFPDIAAVHGRLQRDEITPYFAALNAAIDAGPGTTIWKNSRKAANNNLRNNLLARYPGDGNPWSRLSHIPVNPGAHGPMESPPCFSTDCTSFGIHGAIFDSDIQPTDYATKYYTPHVRELTATAQGVPEANVTVLDGNLLTGTTSTFYKFYSTVERVQTVLQDFPASNGATWNPTTSALDAGAIENYFVRTWPENFAAVYPSVDLAGEERRRIRVSVVNCGSMESVDLGDGSTTYRAQVVDVVDVFLTQPPKVETCTTSYDATTDPMGIRPCANDQITRADLHVEYVGSVRDDLVSSRSRTYAVLVH